MLWDWSLDFQAIVVCIALVISGADTLCDITEPTTETAYVGADAFTFPSYADYANGNAGPSRCRWLISAYKKDYVIHIEFDMVNLERNSRDVCVEEISIYNGSKTTDNVIARFCGPDKPKLLTSAHTVLVVFSSNKFSIRTGTFRLIYKAFKDRHQSEDLGQMLRIGLGSFLGAIAGVVVFSWAYQKYKHGQQGSGVFIFGRGRHCTGRGRHCTGRGRHNVDATARTEVTRVARDGQMTLQRQSFKNKVAGFFQDVAIMFSPRRMTVDSVRTESIDNVNHQQNQMNHQQNQPRQQPNTGGTITHTLSNGNNRNRGDIHAPNIPRDAPPGLITISQADPINDHVTFGYPMIPLNSFTSDPDAVRPPTYEDCIKSVSPLYLHHHGRSTIFNVAFTLKDEESSCAPISSPPPPYTEISSEIPQGAWGQPAQAPPQYEATPSNSATTTPDQETARYDSLAPEQCCERGESVICLSPSQERAVVIGNRTNATTQLTDTCICESFVAATIVQPIAILELPSSISSVNYNTHHQPVVENGGTSAEPEVPDHVSLNNAAVVRAATLAPVDLLRRSGLLPSYSTDRFLPSEDNGSRVSIEDVAVPRTSDPNPST